MLIMLHDIFQEKLNLYKNINLTILQIGGCDGVFDDPIYSYVCKYKSNLHVIEPIKKYYNQLVINYSQTPTVITYNCAITNKTGKDYINYIDCTNNIYFDWLKGCSSFYTTKNVISGYIGKSLNIKIGDDIAQYIKNNTIKYLVDCYTLSDFLIFANLNCCDVIITDTEGMDFEIFKQIDFTKWHPKMYYSEFYNLTNVEKIEIINILTNLNYTCITDGYNILAYE